MRLCSAAALLCLVLFGGAWAEEPVRPSAIFVMKADGSEVRKVAEVKGYAEHGSPRWSHDGKQLAFDASRVPDGVRACFVVGADGAGLREVAKGRFPDWSPDDKQLAFHNTNAEGTAEVFVQNLDGQGLVKIAAGSSPRWSADGSSLVYSDQNMLHAVDLLTGEQNKLLSEPQEVCEGFAWSPGGNQVAVVVQPPAYAPRRLLLVDPASSKAALDPRPKGKLGGSVSYSSDGKLLAYSEAGEILTIEVAGEAQPNKIAGQQGENWDPAISPDGQWIAFTSSGRLDSGPARMAVTGREKTLQELRRHEKRSIVWSVDFTPDGRQVVLGGANNTGVQVWDLATGETRDLGGKGMLVQMFPDGRRFATSWTFRNAHVIDVESGDVLREIDNVSRIWAFGVSSDGRKLLTGGLDKIIRIWDADSGETLLSMEAQPDYILRAAFSPDGKEVITVGHDHTLRTFDTTTGKERLNVGHPAAVWGLAVSADGRHILTGTGGSLTGSLTGLNLAEGDDNVLRMWDRESGKLVREMKGHTGGVFCIDVSPDGQLAATGSSDGTLRLWDLSTGEERSKMGPGKGIVACVRFSPDSQLIVAGGGVARIQGEMIEFPTEQIRVYKILDAGQEEPRKQPHGEAQKIEAPSE